MNDVGGDGQVTLEASAQRPRGRLVPALAVALGLAALAGLGWYLAHRGSSKTGAAAMARSRAAATVGLAAAERADIPITLEALGTVTPLATAVVRAQVSGVVTEVLFHEGQMVAKGQPLAQIDPRPFQDALEQAQGNLARDRAQLDAARVTLERDRTLLAQDSIAQQDVDTQAATVGQLEGTVISDRAAISTAQLNLAFSHVTAPIAGRVGLRAVDPGNTANPSDANGVATITQLTPMDVVFALPSDAIGRVQQRLAARATLPVTVFDRTRTSALASGSFLTLDNQVDAATGTVKAKARFANTDAALFPQQFVNVRVLLDTLRGALVVPAAALRHGPQGDFVFTVGAEKSAHIRIVKPGPADGDRVAILSGLEAGEQVVTEGGDRLTEGAAVRMPGGPGAAGGPGARPAGAAAGAGTGPGTGAAHPWSGQPRDPNHPRHRPGAAGGAGGGGNGGGGGGDPGTAQ